MGYKAHSCPVPWALPVPAPVPVPVPVPLTCHTHVRLLFTRHSFSSTVLFRVANGLCISVIEAIDIDFALRNLFFEFTVHPHFSCPSHPVLRPVPRQISRITSSGSSHTSKMSVFLVLWLFLCGRHGSYKYVHLIALSFRYNNWPSSVRYSRSKCCANIFGHPLAFYFRFSLFVGIRLGGVFWGSRHLFD